MSIIEDKVKKAFISIYFCKGKYIDTMHNSINEQMNSYVCIISKPDGNDHVIINNKDYLVPKIPKPFI